MIFVGNIQREIEMTRKMEMARDIKVGREIERVGDFLFCFAGRKDLSALDIE
jgi:hypothetical protein